MRVILFFFVLTMLMVGGLYLIVHRETRPEEPILPAAASKIRFPTLPSPPLEPAQPPNSHINKCVRGGKVLYTDDPCPHGQAEHKLDPQRSKINVMRGERGQPTAEPGAGRAPAHAIQIDDDGRIRRGPAG